ncbi:MAG: hypothetical protein LKCHEGNO_00973 [Burkholderiaceae bacterium]|nr:hypothetical protein [Burkholderiaceae bacterium]
MKIGPLENKIPPAPAGAQRKPAAEPATPASPEPSAKVELSATASAIAGGLADGSFDAHKVEQLTRAIRDGQFRIDPQAIADKLLANARELLDRGRH